MQLSTLDWLIIVGYFFLTLAVGLFFCRRAGSSLSEFFVSGRSLPWWIAGTSMVATTFAADTPLAVTNIVFKHGLAGNWWWWSFAFGGMITVFVYARLWRRANVLTDVELVELRYGGRPASFLRGFRALYVALLVNPIIMGWVTKAMLTVLKETVLYRQDGTNTANDWTIIVICLAVVGVYAALSGLWGVAITDFLQFFTAMFGSIALAVVAVRHIGGIEAMQQKVADAFEGGDQAFQFLPDFQANDPWMPLNIFLILLLVQWWASWYPGAEPGGGGYIVQRMASCKDERHSVLATLWFQIAHYCVRPWPWLLVAFAALALYPDLHQQLQQDSSFDAGVGYPRIIRELAPSGLRGLMLVTFFAAYMSTISTQINWGSSYLISDFYKRFVRPDANETELTRASRIVTIGMLILGGIAAWLLRNRSIDEAWKLLMALGAGTGAVFMLRWFWWRINAWSEIAAMISSLVYLVLVTTTAHYCRSDLASEQIMAIVACLTICTWLLATYLTAPESNDTLVRFYTLVRPGGPGWRPIATKAPGVVADDDLGVSLIAALLASGIVFFTIPGVGLLIFGKYGQAAVCIAGAVLCAIGVARLMKRIENISRAQSSRNA